ncbi:MULTISPECIES: hypothetical protein [Pelosinus]|uniref:Uncharacterized protein n=1 Tax=Pelosinus fermentans B4 TaxID=1149862 RepID=I8RI52_9FIRM|nr:MULTISPECIES: hypothetical protein [Pelosinus]EIW19503.1 hypothetical protein FB4_2686 [Pelosinus fermentans B4]EIW24764.1 hypothetical protein FA11_3155 [Pelosinus fermentans A11]OAM95955.1 hypothetical protein FR7_03977 [Pelosinus fermentans DSM 17108]SDR34718.1 hypothetical protein SAMN04515679_4145 [Pelosinus fermentans]
MYDKLIAVLLGAFLGFIFGNANKFLIDPLIDLKKAISDAKYTLEFTKNKYTSPLYSGTTKYDNYEKVEKKYKDVETSLRVSASRLRVSIDSVVWFKMFHLIGLIPSEENLKSAASRLLRLSEHTLRGLTRENTEDGDKCIKELNSRIWRE